MAMEPGVHIGKMLFGVYAKGAFIMNQPLVSVIVPTLNPYSYRTAARGYRIVLVGISKITIFYRKHHVLRAVTAVYYSLALAYTLRNQNVVK